MASILLYCGPYPWQMAQISGLAKGFRKLGWDANFVFFRPAPREYLAAIDLFRPDVIFEINVPRSLRPAFDRSIRHVVWFQDLLEPGFQCRFAGSESDIAYFCAPLEGFYGVNPADVPEARHLDFAVDEDIYAHAPRERTHRACMIGHMKPPMPAEQLNAPLETSAGPVANVAQLIDFVIAQRVFMWRFSARDYLEAVRLFLSHHAGQPVTLGETTKLSSIETIWKLIDRKMFIDDAIAALPDLALFGYNWDAWQPYAANFRGPATDPSHAAAVMNSSMLGLHSGSTNLHPRVFDMMACACAPVLPRLAKDDGSAIDIRRHFVPGEDFFEYDPEAPRAALAAFAEQPDRAAAVAASGAAKVRARHTWTHRARQIVAELAAIS